MKFTKFFAQALLALVLGSFTLVSCQQEQEAVVANQPTDARAFAENLYALSRTENASPEQVARYQKGMKNLTFEQSEAFLQVVYEKGLASAKNDDATLQEVERFHALKKELNKEAMSQFGKSFLVLESAQAEAVEKAVYTQLGMYNSAPNGKVAVPVQTSCNFAEFPFGAPYTTNLNDARVSTGTAWVDNDRNVFTFCDCQFAYATTATRYDRSGSTNTGVQTILQNRSPGRRIITSGATAGTYLIVGTRDLNAYATCADFGALLRLVD
jgi:hypothetical protein